MFIISFLYRFRMCWFFTFFSRHTFGKFCPARNMCYDWSSAVEYNGLQEETHALCHQHLSSPLHTICFLYNHVIWEYNYIQKVFKDTLNDWKRNWKFRSVLQSARGNVNIYLQGVSSCLTFIIKFSKEITKWMNKGNAMFELSKSIW